MSYAKRYTLVCHMSCRHYRAVVQIFQAPKFANAAIIKRVTTWFLGSGIYGRLLNAKANNACWIFLFEIRCLVPEIKGHKIC